MILMVIEVYQHPILSHKKTGKSSLIVQTHEIIQKSWKIDSNDTLVCDDEAHKVALSAHSLFFWWHG